MQLSYHISNFAARDFFLFFLDKRDKNLVYYLLDANSIFLTERTQIFLFAR